MEWLIPLGPIVLLFGAAPLIGPLAAIAWMAFKVVRCVSGCLKACPGGSLE